MVFRRYEFQVLFRLMLIVTTCLATVYVWQLQAYPISFFNLVLLLIAQVYFLFRYLNRWLRDVKVFANSVKHGDYNITYHLVDRQDAYYELYQMLNSISSYVRGVKAEAVQQNHYFQYIVENSQVGLTAYDENGVILLSNAETSRLLGTRLLKNIHQIKEINPHVYGLLSALELNQPKLIRLEGSSALKLSARLQKIVIDEKPVFLLSLINIKPELDENELQSWQDLISVLTHEIMNSITPINSLAGSMDKYLDRISGNDDMVSKAKHSLTVMSRRSQALMNFVDRYRMISTVPLPRMEKIDLSKLVADVLTLMESELDGISVGYTARPAIASVDPSLIEQVIINLIKNAIHALDDVRDKRLRIEILADDRFIQVRISDSGCGIPSSVIDKIFIPFFTTRDQGSGIGLTLSRQIMHRHGGTIEVESKEGMGATFILSLPVRSQELPLAS